MIRYGTDSSGRAVLMTPYMRDVWEALLRLPEVAPFASKVTIVQGAFMASLGGGASASAGYHDQGGCLDIRTWNLSAPELENFIRASRRIGFPFWVRDQARGGMDPHAHGVLGTDTPLASGAAFQWSEYRAGRNGLSSRGSDYHWRPSPLVLKPPAALLEEDDMFSDEDRQTLNQISAGLRTFRQNSYERDAKLRKAVAFAIDQLAEIAKDVQDDATRAQVSKARADILAALEDTAPET